MRILAIFAALLLASCSGPAPPTRPPADNRATPAGRGHDAAKKASGCTTAPCS